MPSDAAQRAVEVIDAAYAKATPGGWHAARLERMDEPGVQREGHVGFGALHTPHNARVVGANWSDDAQFIALAHNNWPIVRAHIRTLEAENARLTRWMQPKVTLSIGLDYHDCEIVDVGHSEIQLMVRCPDLEAENARLTASLADAKAEGERAEKKVAVMREILERVQWCMPLSIQSPLYCPTCEHRTDLGHAPDCAIHIAIKNSAREAHLAALASGGQAGN